MGFLLLVEIGAADADVVVGWHMIKRREAARRPVARSMELLESKVSSLVFSWNNELMKDVNMKVQEKKYSISSGESRENTKNQRISGRQTESVVVVSLRLFSVVAVVLFSQWCTIRAFLQ